ncbi:MAG: DNA-3-methyladenine glycosylase, partial [Dehalococcoidia bacterium]
ETPALSLEVIGDGVSSQARAIVAQEMTRMLALTVDLLPFYAMAREDPLLMLATQSFYGLHPPQTASVFEALIMAIIGQQISGVVARAIRGRTVQALGTSFIAGGETAYIFPKPVDFLRAGQERLRSLGLSARKAEYILGIASSAADGTLDLRMLETLSNQQVVEELVRLRGVGPWTAQWVLLRALGRTDAFPAGDLALRRVISEGYLGGRVLGETEAAAFAQEHWGAYAGLATTYLFAYLRRRRSLDGGSEIVPGA